MGGSSYIEGAVRLVNDWYHNRTETDDDDDDDDDNNNNDGSFKSHSKHSNSINDITTDALSMDDNDDASFKRLHRSVFFPFVD